MLKKNLPIILVILLTLLLAAIVIWFFNKRIENMNSKAMTGAAEQTQIFQNKSDYN